MDEDIDMLVGLIVVRRRHEAGVWWQRIGVCLWEAVPDSSWEASGGVWHAFEGELG